MLKILQDHKMAFLEFFGLTTNLFKMKFKSLALITLVFGIPLSFINAFIFTKSMSIVNIINSTMSGNMLNTQALGQLWLYLLILLLFSMLIEPICSVATAIVAKKTLYDEEISAGKALLLAFEKGPSIIFAGIIYSICVGFGYILIVLGVYLAVIWYFYYITIAVDDLPAVESLSQSKKMVKGQWWSTFGIILLLGLIVQAFSYLLMAVLSIGGENIAIDTIYYLFLYFVRTYITLFITMIYMNRKFMIEKQDINTHQFPNP